MGKLDVCATCNVDESSTAGGSEVAGCVAPWAAASRSMGGARYLTLVSRSIRASFNACPPTRTSGAYCVPLGHASCGHWPTEGLHAPVEGLEVPDTAEVGYW